jgi:hypothetical protein
VLNSEHQLAVEQLPCLLELRKQELRHLVHVQVRVPIGQDLSRPRPRWPGVARCGPTASFETVKSSSRQPRISPIGVSVSGCKNRSQYSLIRPSVVLSPLCSSEALAWKMISWATQIKLDRKVLKLPDSFQVLVNGLTLCMARKLKSGEL